MHPKEGSQDNEPVSFVQRTGFGGGGGGMFSAGHGDFGMLLAQEILGDVLWAVLLLCSTSTFFYYLETSKWY